MFYYYFSFILLRITYIINIYIYVRARFVICDLVALFIGSDRTSSFNLIQLQLSWPDSSKTKIEEQLYVEVEEQRTTNNRISFTPSPIPIPILFYYL
jgi:hypothetical protein